MIVNAIHTAGNQTVKPEASVAKQQIPLSSLCTIDSLRSDPETLIGLRISDRNMMTPLPRWVLLALLALLLAVAVAHPGQHACVRLCRAESRGPGTTGVCEHRQKLVPQSSGGRFPIHRLFRLCLDPRAGPGSPSNAGPLLFDSCHTCRGFRESLIRRHACSCPDRRDDETGKLDGSYSPRLEGSSKDRQHELNSSDFAEVWLSKLGKIVEAGAVKTTGKNIINALGKQRGDKIEELLEAEMKSSGAEADKVEVEAIADLVVKDSSSDELITGAEPSEEPPVDWDQWCMALCNNGRGGSACNCDIIP